MDITITPGKLCGTVTAISSKSQAHRLLICAAFADRPTTLLCPETNRDMDATAGCLNALGARITRTEIGYAVSPVRQVPAQAHVINLSVPQSPVGGDAHIAPRETIHVCTELRRIRNTVQGPMWASAPTEAAKANGIAAQAVLNCHDSGSTLRFLLPVAGALGVDTLFQLEGRLPQRPLSPLWEEMERMGCSLSRPSADTIRCQGRLQPGDYTIDGGVSSQFITGLLLAAALIPGDSRIHLTGKVESRPYITMTQRAMALFGVNADDFHVHGGETFHSPGTLIVEGDWSNGAFFLAAKALGNDVVTENLSPDSPQGDRAVHSLLPALEENITISAADIPDLVPILAVVAACKRGAVFTDIRRLRLKESDRVAAVIGMLQSLGGKAEATEDTLTVYGTGLTGGTVDSVNDHRIAMSAAIAATVCQRKVTILGAECVQKSYPRFFAEYRRLGGNYEQYLR